MGVSLRLHVEGSLIVNPPSPSPSEVLRSAPDGLMNALQYPFFQAVWDRKSRRVGLGMQVESDILKFARVNSTGQRNRAASLSAGVS